MEELQSDCNVSQKDDDPFASVPGTLSKFLTGLYSTNTLHISDIRILEPYNIDTIQIPYVSVRLYAQPKVLEQFYTLMACPLL